MVLCPSLRRVLLLHVNLNGPHLNASLFLIFLRPILRKAGKAASSSSELVELEDESLLVAEVELEEGDGGFAGWARGCALELGRSEGTSGSGGPPT